MWVVLGNANLDSFISANFTVEAGESMNTSKTIQYLVNTSSFTGANKLTRPVAGGEVSAGVLKVGVPVASEGV